MSRIIFDSSALIALFAKKKGHDIMKRYLKDAIISSVNIAEVYKYYIEIQEINEEESK